MQGGRAPTGGDPSGHVEHHVAKALGLGLGHVVVEDEPWVKAIRSWAMSTSSSQQALLAKAGKGKFLSPVSLAQRMRSSTRAWPRCRASR